MNLDAIPVNLAAVADGVKDERQHVLIIFEKGESLLPPLALTLRDAEALRLGLAKILEAIADPSHCKMQVLERDPLEPAPPSLFQRLRNFLNRN